MALLTNYVERAIERGLIDEWHVWEFARDPEDSRWLRGLFPATQVTPSHTTEYFLLPERLSFDGGTATLPFSVRALNDVHIALRRISGEGASYEIVLGGWGNQGSAIRKFDRAGDIVDIAARDPQQQPVALRSTPGLLPEFGASDVSIDLASDGLKVVFRGELVLELAEQIAVGDFEVLYKTGFGSNGDWSFSCCEKHPARLFVAGPEVHFAPNAMFYTRAYQYYTANHADYRDDVFLKCDDDIVYFDLDRLAEFIAFRKAHHEYFLVSANVINNGVCAHYQQKAGAIPPALMECELPPGGLCGSLWSEGEKAESLHKLFLQNPKPFHATASQIVWTERISINFVAFLGEDLIHIPDLMQDDEHDLCYGVRKRAKKQNCIYPQFVAAHLSFWKQDAGMNIAEILRGYRALATAELERLAA